LSPEERLDLVRHSILGEQAAAQFSLSRSSQLISAGITSGGMDMATRTVWPARRSPSEPESCVLRTHTLP
jgi:hypothetical protein